jgi:predicted amidohydrolase YtcJ
MDAQGRGYQVAIHALGDRAIEQSQNAIATALDGGPNTPRHRIEHNALVRPDLIPRYAEIGIVPMIFGKFPTCAFVGDTSKFKYRTPTEYITWEWPYRPLIDSNPGLHFAWHSDYPVFSSIDPMEHLYGMLTRKEVSEDGVRVCEPPEWAADDRLTVEEALPMMTIEAAYALQREGEIGSLKAGKLADLIVLSDNPLEVSHDAILDIQVLVTMVGGRVEHCSQGYEALCP